MKNLFRYFGSSIVLAFTLLILGFGVVYAAPSTASPSQPVAPSGCASKYGIPTWYRYLKTDANCNLDYDGFNLDVFVNIVWGLASIAAWIAGLLSVVVIMWAGFQFITSDGSPEKIANARKTMLNACIGLIVAVLASILIPYVYKLYGGL